MDLSKMNKILEVNESNWHCVIEPGVTARQLQDELEKHQLKAMLPAGIHPKEPLQVNETLRAQLVRDGVGPMPEHKGLIKSVKNYDNPWMQPRTQRDRWAKKLEIKDVDKKKQKPFFFVGCTVAFDNTQWHVAQNTAKIMLAAGTDLGMLGKKEICCGSPVARIGDRETFISLATRNIEFLNNTGAKEIVTFCPGCYRSLNVDYKEIPGVPELKPKVYHTSQYYEKLIKEGKIKFKNGQKKCVTWHDPCHLGVHELKHSFFLGVYTYMIWGCSVKIFKGND